jgi:hypothetical protein
MARKRQAVEAVLTANRLIDGAVVWRTPARAWSERFADAAILPPETVDAALAESQADERNQIIVGLYATPLADGAPASVKERIRAFGPTV